MAAEGSSDRTGDRATVPAVGKALEAGIVVLYVGLLTTALFGGYVADYRTAAGDELGERTLATASHEIRAAVPPAATAAQVHVRVEVPDTIRGEGYRIRAEGRSLVLDHPAAGVGGRTRMALPERVTEVTGSWHSQRPAAVRVEGTDGGLSVRLVSGEDAERGLPPDDGDDGRCPEDSPIRLPWCDDDDDDCREPPWVRPPGDCDDDGDRGRPPYRDPDPCDRRDRPPVRPPRCDDGGDDPGRPPYGGGGR